MKELGAWLLVFIAVTIGGFVAEHYERERPFSGVAPLWVLFAMVFLLATLSRFIWLLIGAWL